MVKIILKNINISDIMIKKEQVIFNAGVKRRSKRGNSRKSNR